MNRLERVHAEDRFVQLAADAIRRQHPQSAWLRDHGHLGQTGLTDRALKAASDRLTTWLNEQSGQE